MTQDKSLKKSGVLGIVWDALGTFLNRSNVFIISIVLARILEVEDFGVVTVAMGFIFVTQPFIDVGFTSALIQNQNTNNLTYSSVFYLNLVLAITATIVFYFIAPFLGSFYPKAPEKVADLIRWLSLSFIFSSLNMVQSALLKKSINFKVITLRKTLASLLSGLLGIAAALYGMGYYALVVQALSSGLIGAILLWSVSGWRPDLNFSFKEIKKVIGYSSYVFYDQVLTKIVTKIDVLLIGKYFSPMLLGFYSRSENLRDQVDVATSTSINNVFFPLLSSIQDDEKKFRDIYHRLLSVVSFLAFGLTGLLFFSGKFLILTLYGTKWWPCVPIFQIVIIAGVNRPITALMVTAMLSKGKSKLRFTMGLYRRFFSLAIFLALIISFKAYLIAMVISAYFLMFSIIWLFHGQIGLDRKKNMLTIFNAGIPMFFWIIIYQLTTTYWGWHGNQLWFAAAFAISYPLYHYLTKSIAIKLCIEGATILYQSIILKKGKLSLSAMKTKLLD